MRKLTSRTGIAAGLVAATGLTFGLAGTAHADTSAPRAGDVVGVGSDTLQNAADFLLDGAPGSVTGYNSVGNNNRAYSFFATGDANGRAVYDGTCGAVQASTGLGKFCDSTTNSAPNLLPASVVLRAGTKPVVRPNGSGAGIGALVSDSTGGTGYEGLPLNSIQFARASRLPNATEIGNCDANAAGCGALHVYQAATDQLQIAHIASGYAGPSGLSAQELVGIYQCTITKWNQLPGNSGGSTDVIDPLIPQSGSGTRNFFLADLQAANGGTAVTPGTCVRTVEEHDPTGIYSDPAPADAIEPFSAAKLTLINSGYFANGAGYTTTGGKNAYTPNTLTVLTGTPGDTNPNYNSTRGVYFVIRNVDLSSTTPFQSGGTQNFAKTLFSGATSFIARSANAPLIASAGFTAAYKDCGTDPTSC